MSITCKIIGHKINTLNGSGFMIDDKQFLYRHLICHRCRRELEPVILFYKKEFVDLIESLDKEVKFDRINTGIK